MTETTTTTIQIRKDQAETLNEIKRQNGNYKTVIDRLIESHEATEGSDTQTVAELLDTIDSMAYNGQMEDGTADNMADQLKSLDAKLTELQTTVEAVDEKVSE